MTDALDTIRDLTAELERTQAKADLIRAKRAALMAKAKATTSAAKIGEAAGMSHVGVLLAVRDVGPGTPRAKQYAKQARELGVTL
jgi:hypothetical protein